MDVDFATVNAVDQSWNIIRNIPNYEQVAGEILFRKIFELAPGALGMYQFGEQFQDGPQEELYKHPVFVSHAKGVVAMLDVAINLLGPDMVPVTIALKDLGARHIEYGVLPAHYDVVGEALLYTLEAALGDNWTEPVKQGWIGVYTFVSTTMKEGAEAYLKEKIGKQKELKEKQAAEIREAIDSKNKPSASLTSSASTVSMTSLNSSASKNSNNQLPIVQKSRKSLHEVLFRRRRNGREKKKKVPNSRVEDRSMVSWLDKALKISAV